MKINEVLQSLMIYSEEEDKEVINLNSLNSEDDFNSVNIIS